MWRPWNEPNIIERGSVDLILTHMALQHITNLENTYKAFSLWLNPKGWMSHQIDFTSHGITKELNGHWTYPEWLWKIIVGKRSYFINKQPCSRHTDLLKQNGFRTICVLKDGEPEGLRKSQQMPEGISEDDFGCSGAFIQARKLSETNVLLYNP